MSLRELRLEQQVKQEELAEAIGVSPAMISRYERGLSIPPADKVVKMAEYLHTSIDSLMDYRRHVIYSDVSPTDSNKQIVVYPTKRSLDGDRIIEVSSDIEEVVIDMADGTCELCGLTFQNKDFLETHFVVWIRNGGQPTLTNTVALCPNCHRKIHFEATPADVVKIADVAASHKL